MATYNVRVIETQTYEFEMEAHDEDEAKSLSYQAWENGDLGYAGLEVEVEVELEGK